MLELPPLSYPKDWLTNWHKGELWLFQLENNTKLKSFWESRRKMVKLNNKICIMSVMYH